MDSIKSIIRSLLVSVGDLANPNRNFSWPCFRLWLSFVDGLLSRFLSRYSQPSERTYRRQYQRSFNFIKFNAELIEQAIQTESTTILAVDCSFIPKSGKQTYGLDYFYNGSAARAEKGLEVSAMAVVDVTNNISYNLSIQQTPAINENTTTSSSEGSHSSLSAIFALAM